MQKLQQLQKQADQLNQMQGSVQQSGQPQAATTSYPKIAKEPENVEDILNNPVWLSELQTQFSNSELGRQAKTYWDVRFAEFCEKESGYKSNMLDGLRKQAQSENTKKPPKKAAEPEEFTNLKSKGDIKNDA